MTKISSPTFILCRPQMGENIGAAARAALNFGVTDFRIIAPRDGWPNRAAVDNGAGALEMMDVKLFPKMEDAIADLQYVFATTARTRDMAKPGYDGETATREAASRLAAAQNIGFVFGPERTGLTNDEIALCHATVTLPCNPAFSSVNLAQSVAVIAYALRAAQATQTPLKNDHIPAPAAPMEELFQRLENELQEGGFFEAVNLKPTMLRNLRTMLLRAEWSDQEVRTFHGVLSALNGKKREKRPQ